MGDGESRTWTGVEDGQGGSKPSVKCDPLKAVWRRGGTTAGCDKSAGERAARWGRPPRGGSLYGRKGPQESRARRGSRARRLGPGEAKGSPDEEHRRRCGNHVDACAEDYAGRVMRPAGEAQWRELPGLGSPMGRPGEQCWVRGRESRAGSRASDGAVGYAEQMARRVGRPGERRRSVGLGASMDYPGGQRRPSGGGGCAERAGD